MSAITVLAIHPTLAFWTSFWAWIAMELWIFSRDRKAAEGKRRDRGTVFAIILFISAGMTGAFYAPHWVPLARIQPFAPALFWSAIGLIWFGIVLRVWAVLTLGRHFRTAVHILDGHKLVTSGPYRLLRHPSYTGGLITGTAIGLALGNWVSLAAAFSGMLIAYGIRILVEEAALRAAFGEAFEAHKKRTWAIIPFVW